MGLIIPSLQDLEKLGWEMRGFRTGRDGIRFGYRKAKGPLDSELSEFRWRQDYVEVPAGHAVPRHYHEKRVEGFIVLYGEATLLTRDLSHFNRPEQTRSLKKGDTFDVPPRTNHRVENHGDASLYLLRIAIYDDPKDSVLME